MSASILVGTLNCLGEAFNPFEFVASSNAAHCDTLHAAIKSLSYADLVAACGAGMLEAAPAEGGAALAQLRSHCDQGAALWTFFDEPALANDNKLLSHRLNLLTFAMSPWEGSAAGLQWELLGGWPAAMTELVERAPETYAKDPKLWLWDLVCNAVASAEPAAFQSVCASTHLNPSNFRDQAERFVSAATAAAVAASGSGTGGGETAMVLGIQEWPRDGTVKGAAFRAAFAAQSLQILEGGHAVALVHSSSLGHAQLVDTACAKAVMQACLDAMAEAGDTIDEKTASGFLKTTSQKVLAARFPEAPAGNAAAGRTFVVVHAKEPKSPQAATLLAEFVLRLGDRLATAEAPSSELVAMMDTNLGKASTAAAFAERVNAQGFESLPQPGADTTAKQRSYLHGQIYDEAKCMKLVRAPKDKLVAARACLTGVGVTPDLGELGDGGLPSASWASDHAFVYGTLAPASRPKA